jgi:hypothetical protein
VVGVEITISSDKISNYVGAAIASFSINALRSFVILTQPARLDRPYSVFTFGR